MSFWTNYAFALAIVGLVLAGLAVAGRVLKGAGSRSRSGGGHIAIVESVMLSPRASLHVVKAGRRHLLIGSTDAYVCALAEMELEKE
ncbi:MAG: flagellar biosynthetic protein FliO [Candidatus Tumulicola sp.]